MRANGSVEQYTISTGQTLWSIRYRVPDRLGNVTHKRERGFRTKREAQRILRHRLTEIEKGEYIAPSSQPFKEYAEAWLTRQESRLKPSTLHSYRRNLRLHIFPSIGGAALQRIDSIALDELYADRIAAGLSPTTVLYLHVIVGSVFRDAVRRGFLATSPTETATPPRKARETQMRTWDPKQISAFLAATVSDRRGPLWRLLFATGLRRGEALGLTWDDVDLDSGRLTIVRSLVDAEWGKPVFSTPKTNAGRRTIHLDEATVSALRALRTEQAKERLLHGSGYRDHGLVFCYDDGTPYHPDRVSKAFKEAAKAAGLPVIRLHDTRHSHATLALVAGVPVKVVQERLGHSTPAITMAVYQHATPGMDQEAADTVAALFA